MSTKPGSKQTRPTKSSQPSTISNRPPRTVNELVTSHDIQIYRLTRACHELADRLGECERRLQDSEESSSAQPTFEEETDPSGGSQLQVVVEES